MVGPNKIALIAVIVLLPTLRITARVLTLEQAIREVCERSDSVAAMKESLEKSAQSVRERWASVYPSISVSILGGRAYGLSPASSFSAPRSATPDINVPSVSLSRLQLDKITRVSLTPEDSQQVKNMIGSIFSSLASPVETPVYSASISLTQPVFTFGKVGNGIKAAHAFNRSVRHSYFRNLQGLQLAALDAFFRVVVARSYVYSAEQSTTRQQELSSFLTRNFRMGSGSKAQVLAAQADLKRLSSETIDARSALHSAVMSLNALMKRDLMEDCVPDTAEIPQSLLFPLPASEKEAMDTAIADRKDLYALQSLAEANRSVSGIYNSTYFPNAGIQASFGTGGSNPSDLIHWSSRNWIVGAGLQWTAFDGFAGNSKARQYRSDARKLEIIRDNVINLIRIEVSTAYTECNAADTALAASCEALSASIESYTLTKDNFMRGAGQFSDIQLAAERLRQAETTKVNAQYRFIRSRASLLTAMGRIIVNLE